MRESPLAKLTESPAAAIGMSASPPVWRLNAALTVCFAVAIAARMPSRVIGPSFWAEEGALYFRYAYEHPWFDALVKVHGPGYFAFLPNLIGVLAARVPLEWSPSLALGLSWFGQMIPCLVLLHAARDRLADPIRRVGALLFLLLAMPSQEVWLNSINLQFHLAAAAGFIFILPAAGGFRRAILVLACLCSPPATFLAPLFLLEAWRQRERERWIQAVIVCACGSAQLAVIIDHAAQATGSRFVGFDAVAILGTVLAKTLAQPFFGADVAGLVIRIARAAGSMPVTTAGALVLGVAIATTLWRLLRDTPGARTGLAAAWLMASLGALGALGELAPQRYFYAPNVLLGLVLALAVGRPGPVWRSRLIRLFAALFLINGAIEFQRVKPFFRDAPSWARSVAAWRSGATNVLFIPPRLSSGYWSFPLAPRPGDIEPPPQ